jgi:ABC-2 type transport system permease protein
MSATAVDTARPAPTAGVRASAGLWQSYRVEVRKLRSQWIPRVVFGLCVLGPFAFVAIMKTQTTLPADTLFGRWLHTTGFAVPLFLLGVAAEGGFFLLTSLVAGDIFASEDRYGTWQTVLTRACRRRDVFIGKLLAATTFSLVAVATVLVASLAAGALLVGTQPLIDLSGVQHGTGQTLALVAAAWASAILPVIAFTSMGALFSIATRSTVMGVVGPVVVGFLMELLGVLGFRTLVLTTPFEAWHGFMVDPGRLNPLLQGSLVSLVYIVVCTGLAWLLFRGRDFAGPSPTGGGQMRSTRMRVGAVAIAAVILVAVASFRPSPVTSAALQKSVPATFTNLLAEHMRLTGRPAYVRGQAITPAFMANVTTSCRRGGNLEPARGPGDDWVCAMTSGKGPNALIFGYEVNAHANGCYTAQGSSAIFGHPMILDRRYDTVVNPLYEFDGCLGVP